MIHKIGFNLRTVPKFVKLNDSMAFLRSSVIVELLSLISALKTH